MAQAATGERYADGYHIIGGRFQAEYGREFRDLPPLADQPAPRETTPKLRPSSPPPPSLIPRGDLADLAKRALERRRRHHQTSDTDSTPFERQPTWTKPQTLCDVASRFIVDEHWVATKKLGHGGYGVAFLLENNEGGVRSQRVGKVVRPVPSLKVPLKDRGNPRSRAHHLRRARYIRSEVLNEVYKLTNMRPNDRIIQFYEHRILNHQCELYFEYCDAGTLNDIRRFYQMNNQLIPESFLWHAFQQLAEGLAFLHQGYDHKVGPDASLPKNWKTVIHADIKPENVFLRRGKHVLDYPDLVIGDFGCATYVPLKDGRGTVAYQPPEYPSSSIPADIWAIGAILHELCTYVRPIPPMAMAGIWTSPSRLFIPTELGLMDVQNQMDLGRWALPFFEYSVTLEQCTHQCLEYLPENRPTAHEVVADVLFEMECGMADELEQQPLLDYLSNEE